MAKKKNYKIVATSPVLDQKIDEVLERIRQEFYSFEDGIDEVIGKMLEKRLVNIKKEMNKLRKIVLK